MQLRRCCSGRRAWVRGFTLIELLVTLAVVAILLVVAAPYFADLLRNNEASAFINDYVYALRLARSEAVTESLPVTVCQTDDLKGCSGNNDWEKGWLVFRDPNGDGTCADADADDACDTDGGAILLRRNPDAQDFEFSANGNPGNGAVRYDRSGYAEQQQSTFSLCDGRGRAEPRGVTLSDNGRTRSADVDKLNCP